MHLHLFTNSYAANLDSRTCVKTVNLGAGGGEGYRVTTFHVCPFLEGKEGHNYM